MPTPSELAAAVAAAKQAQAAADFAALQAFSIQINTGSWTVADLLTTIKAVIPTLSNPDTAARVSGTAANIEQVVDQFNQLVASVQNTAQAST